MLTKETVLQILRNTHGDGMATEPLDKIAQMIADATGLDFVDLRNANERRAVEWKGGSIGQEVPALFALVELGGEVGEAVVEALVSVAALAGKVGNALNEGKKLARTEHGLRGGTTDIAPLRKELADVVICADLAARKYGIDLGEAVREKFNLTSEKHGFSTRL